MQAGGHRFDPGTLHRKRVWKSRISGPLGVVEEGDESRQSQQRVSTHGLQNEKSPVSGAPSGFTVCRAVSRGGGTRATMIAAPIPAETAPPLARRPLPRGQKLRQRAVDVKPLPERKRRTAGLISLPLFKRALLDVRISPSPEIVLDMPAVTGRRSVVAPVAYGGTYWYTLDPDGTLTELETRE